MSVRFTDLQRTEVVQRALSQLGKPYQWGAAGPNSYDCSGSVLAAWKPFIELPHNSGALITAPGVRTVARGIRIDEHGKTLHDAGHGALHWPMFWIKPGDLVFYYGSITHPNSVSHVAVFVGKQGKLSRAVVNATGIVGSVNRGVELISMDAYTDHVGIGYVGH